MKNQPVHCGDCGREFPRDPALEVECPTCMAKVGRRCVARRPSGHVHNADFGGLPAWGHDARELLAAVEGKYCCGGISTAEAQRRLDCVLRGERWETSQRTTLSLGLET